MADTPGRMDNNDLSKLLADGAGEYGISLASHQVNAFGKYSALIKEWNEKINLTAIEDDREIVIKHHIDSMSIIPYIKNKGKGLSLIDIGSGAGFPGIPLRIAFEGLTVTLLDSLEKRVKFLNEVLKELGMDNIAAVHGRAEDYGIKENYRESFDIATARAVASLPVLSEYCLPFVKTGGVFIAMKGSSTEEVNASSKALQILGGEIEAVEEFTLPFSDIKRNIIIVKKIRQTPTKYPRKAGKPSKEPLV